MTAASITKAALPIMAGGAGLRLIAAMSKSEDPAVRELSLSLVASAAAMSTLPPTSLATFDRVLGDANYGRFLSQCGTVTAAGFGTGVMVRSALGDEAGPRVWVHRRRMLMTLCVMGTLFGRSRETAAELQEPSYRLFTPPVAAYWMLFAGYMVQSTAETARLAAAASRLAEDRSLRSGLRCVAAGTAVLGGFYVQLALGTLGRTCTSRLPGPIRGVPAQAIIGGCAATIAFGSALPGATWRVGALRRSGSDAIACFRLRPMWRYLKGRNPEVTLTVAGLRRPDLRLFRRVVEILDGLDRLATDRDPRGRVGTAAKAVGEARRLSDTQRIALERAALIRYSRTTSLRSAPSLVDHPSDHIVQRPGSEVHSDYRQEARRLLAASSYLQELALVDSVMQQVSDYTKDDQHAGN